MTTYSVTIPRGNLAIDRSNRPLTYKFNFVLAVLLVASVLTYVFLANLQVAWEYSLNSHKNKINTLSVHDISQNPGSTNSDLETLLLFAQKSGMIEAKDTDSILQDRNFALTQP